MAKKIIGSIKLQIPAGQATPAPPVGPALGQPGVNIMDFCKAFNARTQEQQGTIIPVVITVYADRSFTFITKTPPAAVLLKQAAAIEKGSGEPNRDKVGTVTQAQVEEIAKTKMPDLNAATTSRRRCASSRARPARWASRSRPEPAGRDRGAQDGEARQELPQGVRDDRARGPTPLDEAVKLRQGAARTPSSTRRSRSPCGSASTRGTPTRWCAARSCCRTAPASELRVLVFASGEKVKEAEEAGADYVGGEELAKKIEGGWLEFDAVIATPDMMKVVGRLGRVLGPRGLMPNPKVGTVTFDVGSAVREIKAGKIEFRVDKTAIIHVPIGKTSFSGDQLRENAEALLAAVVRAKPTYGQGQVHTLGERLVDHEPGCPGGRGALSPGWRRRRDAAESAAEKRPGG